MLAVRREAAQNVDGRTALSLIPKHSDSLDKWDSLEVRDRRGKRQAQMTVGGVNHMPETPVGRSRES